MPNTPIKKTAPGQQGFTLIEIIAVLVILGILAAVATPRFIGLQDEARKKALEGAVAAAQSQVSMEYAEQILSTGSESDAWSALDDVTVCDEVQTEDFSDFSNWSTCEHDDESTFEIVAEDTEGNTASGTFTRP